MGYLQITFYLQIHYLQKVSANIFLFADGVSENNLTLFLLLQQYNSSIQQFYLSLPMILLMIINFKYTSVILHVKYFLDQSSKGVEASIANKAHHAQATGAENEGLKDSEIFSNSIIQ